LEYIKYKNLDDILKVMFYSPESSLGIIPTLYHIVNDKSINTLFIYTGMIGNIIIHYVTQNERPDKKFIEVNKNTGKHKFVDRMANDTQSMFIPILDLEQSSLEF
jgi:hypothetical protein